jgi:hypothetical protein
VFSVIERTSIKWYHEIFRKYAEGVRDLNLGFSPVTPSAYLLKMPQLQSFFTLTRYRLGGWRLARPALRAGSCRKSCKVVAKMANEHFRSRMLEKHASPR